MEIYILLIAINIIQIAINIYGNLDALHGNLGHINGTLGALKRKAKIGFIIGKLLFFFDKNSKLQFFSSSI